MAFYPHTKEREEELDILAYTIGPMRGGEALGVLLYGHILEN